MLSEVENDAKDAVAEYLKKRGQDISANPFRSPEGPRMEGDCVAYGGGTDFQSLLRGRDIEYMNSFGTPAGPALPPSNSRNTWQFTCPIDLRELQLFNHVEIEFHGSNNVPAILGVWVEDFKQPGHWTPAFMTVHNQECRDSQNANGCSMTVSFPRVFARKVILGFVGGTTKDPLRYVWLKRAPIFYQASEQKGPSS